MMTGVLLKFTAQPGRRDDLVAHLTETAGLADSEPGTLLWTVHTSPVEADTVWVYEVYRSESEKAAHESSAEYAAARAKTGELLGGAPEAIPLTPVGGKGL